jgi:hypothetical protein
MPLILENGVREPLSSPTQKLVWQFLLTSPLVVGTALIYTSPIQATTINPVNANATVEAELAPIATAPVTAAAVPVSNSAATIAESSPISTSASSSVPQVLAVMPDAPTSTMAQVTSVSQLSDVQPTDWAFQALQSLVERYGCIAGYPDGTFKGNRALTRYEFAAGLNACLDRVNELIAAGTTGLATKEDLATLQKLQEEFAAELATLRGRVDALEARTTELEKNQFSTTTKLTGEVIFGLADAFGDEVDGETVLHDRVRLNFLTSFTGKDRLRTRLQAGNVGNTFQTITGTNEGRFSYDGTTENDIALDILDYRFPIGDKLAVNIFGANALHHYYADTVNPYFEGFGGGNGALSRFGERNPIYRIGPLGAGIGLNFKLSNSLKIDLGYIANEAEQPSQGEGLFNGNYSALAQLVFQPTKTLKLGFTYVNAYDGTSPANRRFTFGGTGTNFANRPWLPAGLPPTPVSSNSYGIEASLKLGSKFAIGGWVGMTEARLIGKGDAEIWNYALTLAFPDLGKKGSLGGIIIGAEPYLTSLDVPGDPDFVEDTPFHIEGFYKYALTKNISVTPGLIWLTAPNQNNDNDDIFIGTIRTTFTF